MFLSLILYGMVLYGLATLRGDILALVLPLLIYFLAGILFNPDRPQLRIERCFSQVRVQPGTPVTVTLIVTNEGSNLERVWLQDTPPRGLEILNGEASFLTQLKQGESTQVQYTILAGRGAYSFRDVHIWVSDQLGLLRQSFTFSPEGAFFVLPQVKRLPQIPIRPRQTRGYAGTTPARQGGTGVTFFGLREYQPGDAQHWVNWRASAKHDQILYSNEYEQERAVDVSLILDARSESYLVGTDNQLFESAVVATASLAQTFLNQGDRVGLVHYGRYLAWTFPGYGKIQKERILYALSRTNLGDSQVDHLEYLPSRFLPSGSQIVLVSPLLHKDVAVLCQLRARGYAMMVISPDPISYEERYLPDTPDIRMARRLARLERVALIRQLQQTGIRVLDWNIEIPFEQAMLSLTRGAARFAERVR